jgi:hypothetical protein
MYARVATFEGGDEARMRQMMKESRDSGDMNTPAGMKRVLVLGGNQAGKRLFIAFFDSADEIAAAEERFEQMGDEVPEGVRGRRLSVDVYEVLADEET